VPAPNTFALVLACIVGVLAIEGGRRMAGPMFAGLAILLFTFPLYADKMPGVLFGMSFPPDMLISMYAFSIGGLLGVPGRVLGEILLGFLVFAGMLIASGATDFFLNFALALVGRTRGGPAKVAVLASGFFGSLSGSPMANVASTLCWGDRSCGLKRWSNNAADNGGTGFCVQRNNRHTVRRYSDRGFFPGSPLLLRSVGAG